MCACILYSIVCNPQKGSIVYVHNPQKGYTRIVYTRIVYTRIVYTRIVYTRIVYTCIVYMYGTLWAARAPTPHPPYPAPGSMGGDPWPPAGHLWPPAEYPIKIKIHFANSSNSSAII